MSKNYMRDLLESRAWCISAQIGDAFRRGDYEEMRRLKAKLDECKTSMTEVKMTEPMSYSDAADILEAHSAWRRGQNDDTEATPKWNPKDTQTLGVAIDVAVDGLRKLQAENEHMRVRCHALANACVTMDLKS